MLFRSPQGQAAERALRRLCQASGVSDTAAQQLIAGAQRSWVSSKATGESRTRQQAALLSPQRVSELTWWGVEPTVIEQHSMLDDGLVREWPKAGSGAEVHESYALQWYTFAAATVVLLGALGWRRNGPAA